MKLGHDASWYKRKMQTGLMEEDQQIIMGFLRNTDHELGYDRSIIVSENKKKEGSLMYDKKNNYNVNDNDRGERERRDQSNHNYNG